MSSNESKNENLYSKWSDWNRWYRMWTISVKSVIDIYSKMRPNSNYSAIKIIYYLRLSYLNHLNQISVNKANKVEQIFWITQRNGHFIIEWNRNLLILQLNHNWIEGMNGDKAFNKRQSNKEMCHFLFVYIRWLYFSIWIEYQNLIY